ncbi:Down-regulated-in-metastasis protein [Trinorchestia longiramus]|nr:Down-regulated-in-metastasis protein [Trinorchestia longiramus]
MTKLTKHHSSSGLSLSKVPFHAKSKKKKSKNSASSYLLPRPAKTGRKGWLGFAERCRRITANPIKVLQQQTALAEDNKTHLSHAIAKWKLLNLSSEFVALQREIGTDIQSVAQLLYHRQRIASALLTHLSRHSGVTCPPAEEQLTVEQLQAQALTKLQPPQLGQDTNDASHVPATAESSDAPLPAACKVVCEEAQNLEPHEENFVSSNLIPRDANYFIKSHKKDTKNIDPEEECSVLEPVLHLVVALATDIPQHFYEHHFYEFLPHIVSYCDSQDPAQIEHVFSCLLNLLVILKADAVKEPMRLYTNCFADLLSSSRPWYINDIAVQTFAFIVRRVPEKESFFYRVFKRLDSDQSQVKGLGKLLTAVMKSNSLNRVHSVTSEVMRIMLNILTLKSVPSQLTMEAFIIGLKGLMCFVTFKNSLKNWEEFWKEDNERVWMPVWRQLDALVDSLASDSGMSKSCGHTSVAKDEKDQAGGTAPDKDSDMKELQRESNCRTSSPSQTGNCSEALSEQLCFVLNTVKFLVNFKRGSLLLDASVAFDKLEPLISFHLSSHVGFYLSDILIGILKSPKHQACTQIYDASRPLQVRRNRIISKLFHSNFCSEVIFSFAKGSSVLPHFKQEVLPKLLRYLDDLVAGSVDEAERLSVLALVMSILLHHQPPVTSGVQLAQWQKFSLTFRPSSKRSNGGDKYNTEEESEVSVQPQSVPELLEQLLCNGLQEGESNVEALLTAVLCVPHVAPLDYQEMSSHIAGVLSNALDCLQVSPSTVMSTAALTPKDRPLKNKVGQDDSKAENRSSLPVLDLNVDVSLSRPTLLLLFLVDVCVEALALILSQRDFLATLTGMNVINILRGFPQHRESEHLLRAIDIYLTVASQAPSFDELIVNPISEETFFDLYKILAPSLASPSAQTRMLVSHIFSLFPLQLPPPPKDDIHVQNMFQIMYQIESMEVTALNYGERLRLMALISSERVDAHSPVSGMCAHAPVLFGIGQMYVNLRPVYGNAVVYVSRFAKRLHQDDFWPLWFSKLKLVSHAALSSVMSRADNSLGEACVSPTLWRVHNYLTSHAGSGKLSKKVDHANVRNLMWKTMHHFAEICELRNRDIVSSFFEFMEKEMEMTDFSVAPTQNLEKITRSFHEEVGDSSCDVHAGEDEEENEDELENTELDADDQQLDESSQEFPQNEENKNATTRKNRGSKLVINSLCNYLNLFSKFYNLKTIHMASDLEKIFMDLLVHPSLRVQELALSCVFSFKKRSIMPYKESLAMIQSDKAFKRGVMTLRIDSSGDDSNSVAEEHREELMPLYVRLLYSKMLTSVGKNTTGKNKILVRKTTVMRLLAGIRDEESKYLLHLAFEILEPHLQGSCNEVVDVAFKGLDPSSSIPLKRMYGILSSLDSMIYYLGNLLPTKQSYFLKIILLLLSHSTVLKDYSPTVDNSHKNLLKKIKIRSMNELLKFYDAFQNYSWSSDELEALFKCAVWPSLAKLPTEGVINIHPLLKLFNKWSENEYLHPLFIKHHSDNEKLSALPLVFSLATEPKCRVAVINYILNIVHNLMGQNESMLQTGDQGSGKKFKKGKSNKKELVQSKNKGLKDGETNDGPVEMVTCANLLPVEEPEFLLKAGEKPSFGTKIVLPHIRALCSCMHTVLHQLVRKSARDTQLLRILCLVTQFVCDGQEGDKLLSLIIPMLNKKKTSNVEVIDHLLLTCSHLLPISGSVERFALKLLQLFHSLDCQTSRSQLCKVFEALSEKCSEYKALSEVMSGLNSWETSFVDSIDISRRMKSYKKLGVLLSATDRFDLALYQFAVHQTSYDLHHMSDVTLQESAVAAFTAMIKSCMSFYDSNRSQVIEVMNSVLAIIKRGVAASSDTVHCLHLKLLGNAVLLAGDRFKPLQDLRNINPDIDFFNNVSHLQMARRALVQNKLINGMSSGKFPLKEETIETYVWPLLCRYITHPHYAQETGLMHATYKNLEEVVLRLPWNAYIAGLKFFLNRLKNYSDSNRLTLKVVGIILDGFHEDVSGLVLKQVKKGKDFKKSAPKKLQSTANTTEAGKEVRPQKVNCVEGGNFTHAADDTSQPKPNCAKTVTLEDKCVVEAQGSSSLKEPAVAAKNAHSLKVYNALVREIIPGLKRVFESRSGSDDSHKMNKTKRASDDDIKKIPLALPLVKLLKKFPESVLEANLGNVFYQLMCFLRSHVPYIRREARDTMVQVLREVGSKFLPGLILDLRVNLKMGFQRHVLIHMVKTLLVSCANIVKSNHVCRCLNEVVELCSEELFANKSVEDRVDDREKDAEPVEEAKGEKKSYAIMGILGRFVQVQRLQDVMTPLKDVLATTHRKSVVVMVEKCLFNFMLGLEANETVSLKEKLIFAYGILTEKIIDFKQDKDVVAAVRSVYDIPDRMLLEPEPKRVKLSAKTSATTNSYVLVNFALGLLFKMLQRQSLSRDDAEHNGMLDPFICLLINFLHSSHPEVTVSCLKCFAILARFPLPSLKEKIDPLVAQMFVLLNKYNSTELEKGLMFNMVQLTFRCLTVVLKYVDYFTLKPDHKRVLLVYMKDNLMNHSQQNTVFSLLQAIIDKKLQAPELLEVMDIIKKLVVTDESAPVLDQCRRLYLDYLINYPIQVRILSESFLYYVENLNYPSVSGRVSICLMIDNLLVNAPSKYFSQKIIKKVWLKLLLTFIREEDPECRKHQQMSLTQVFINTTHKLFLIKESLKLLKGDAGATRTSNATNIQLGCLSCVSFLKDETKDVPINFFSDVLPFVVDCLNPDNFKAIEADDQDCTVPAQQMCIDKALLSLLRLFQTLHQRYHKNSKWDTQVEKAWEYIRAYVLYDELEVRLLASTLIGKLFADYPLEKKPCPPVANSTLCVQSLVKDLVAQFRCGVVVEDKFKQLCLMSVRNLIYLIRQSYKVPMVTESVSRQKKEFSNALVRSLQLSVKTMKEFGDVAASSVWVMSLVAKVAVEDVNTKRTVRREAAFNLMAGVALLLGDDLPSCESVLEVIITEIARENNIEENDKDNETSLTVVTEVAELIKDKLGWEKYGELLHAAERGLNQKRLSRRANKKERFIRNPELVEAERQRKSRHLKLSLKRRRLEGTSIVKRKKKKNMDSIL